jgi:3-deoxy-D-manno-octulosonic-acid transferase
MEKLQAQEPHRPILLTFFSPSGYDAAQNYGDQFVIEYLPLDTYPKARSFISKWNPALAIFIKYEIWPSYLSVLHDRKIPTLVISSRWRPQQIYFRSGRSLFYPLLRKLDHIFVQDALSLDILKAEGLSQATVAGDTRIDRVKDIAKESFSHPMLSAISDDEKIFIMGSSWPADEKLLFETLKDPAWPEFDRILIVPHELSVSHISQLESEAPQSSCTVQQSAPDPDSKIIIVNEMGILAYLYRMADCVYVGGGFGDGIHSILEAAVYGVPVIFGPKHHKFKEAEDLIRLGTAKSVQNSSDLLNAGIHFDKTPIRVEVKAILDHYFREQSGASERVSHYIEQRLKKKT